VIMPPISIDEMSQTSRRTKFSVSWTEFRLCTRTSTANLSTETK